VVPRILTKIPELSLLLLLTIIAYAYVEYAAVVGNTPIGSSLSSVDMIVLSFVISMAIAIIADESFTTENGLMTATLKVRRHMVRDIYDDRLDALYGKR
jgi:hypothetical protein